MVSKKEPDWPPAGWKVESRIKNGRKIKCYTNSKNHQKFFSKPALLRYIKDGRVSNEQFQPVIEHSKKSSGKIQMHLVEENDSEWLPPGWVTERRIRKSGARVGTEYKCYIDPSTGAKFFSKPEVLRYLKSKRCDAGSSRRKDREGSRNSSSKRLVNPQRDHKSDLETEVSQISKTHVSKSLLSGKLKVVTERTVEEELPSGWIKETRIKKLGSEVVRRDLFFIDPASRLVFRSKLDVLRYVETGEVSRHAFQRRNESFTGEDFYIEKTSTSSSIQKETSKRKTKKEPFASEANIEDSDQALLKAEGNAQAEGKRTTRSSSRVGPASTGGFTPKKETLLPKLESNSQEIVVAKALLKKVSGTKETAGMTKQTTPPAVQNAAAEVATLKKSEPSSSAPSKGIFSEENPAAVVLQGCTNGKAQASKRKTKDRILSGAPSRSSKRLAGVNAEVVYHPIPIEHALRATNKMSSRTNPIPSLESVPNELQDKNTDDDSQHWNDHALRATNRKPSGISPIPSLGSVPKEIQEICQDADTQDVLASQEETHGTLVVDAENMLTTQGEPSEKIDDLTSLEEKHPMLDLDSESVLKTKEESSNKIDDVTFQGGKPCTLDFGNENVLATHGEPLDKIDDLTLQEQHCTLDADTETVLATHEETSNKLDDLTSQEEKHCSLDVDTGGEPSNNIVDLKFVVEKHQKLDVNQETVPHGEPSTKIEKDITTKSPLLVDLNDLQLEHAPPGFSENTIVAASPTMSKQSLEHPRDTMLRSKVENTSKGRPILEEQVGSIVRETEQPQSEFCFPSPLWSDPCLEFAYKTLTGAIPFDDNLAIQDYIQHQLRTSEESNDNQHPADICAPSLLKTDEAKMVSQLPEDLNLPEIKQVKNK